MGRELPSPWVTTRPTQGSKDNNRGQNSGCASSSADVVAAGNDTRELSHITLQESICVSAGCLKA